jgi:hypothetical protein
LLLSGTVLLLLANTLDVRDVAVALHYFPGWLSVITLVQAQILRRFLRRCWALDHHCIKRRLQKLEVGHIRSGYNNRELCKGTNVVVGKRT